MFAFVLCVNGAAGTVLRYDRKPVESLEIINPGEEEWERD